MRRLILAIIVLFCVAHHTSIANPIKPKKSKPVADESPLKFNGYLDTYYFANFNGVQTNLGASGFERIFDQKANNFQIGLAQIKTTYTKDKVTGVIDLTFGNHGDLGNYGNKVSPLGTGFGTTGLALKQAYLNYKFNDKVSLTAGQYGTHVGMEVIDAPVNYNYSLSNLFGNGPFYHTGVKLDIAASDKIAFMFGINNGLDSKDDNNKSKGFAGQITLKPTSKFTTYLNYFTSDEGADSKDQYSWYDIVSTLQATEKVALGLNATLGQNAAGSWNGVALYANAALSTKTSLGIRVEQFNNAKGAIYLKDANGDGVSTTGITLTGNVNVSDNLKFKPEYRFDTYKSAKSTFQLYDKAGNLTKDSQSTLGAALIFLF
jgi:Putative beta-barrel porin-2, OmpL-like. bbp2